MKQKKLLSNFIYRLFKTFCSVKENKSRELGSPEKFLIIRQHNQLGDLLAGVSLFRAVKETYPGSHITLIVSPFNHPGIVKNKYLDRVFVFDKTKLFNLSYLKSFYRLLKEEYDVAIVPVVVSISFTSNLIARIAKAQTRIGAASLNGMVNESSFFFDRRIPLDWRNHPDSNVSERSLDIVRPFDINTYVYRSEISFDDSDLKYAEEFIHSLAQNHRNKIIGIHVGANKPANRWALDNYIRLIEMLNEKYKPLFYLTGSNSDKEELKYMKKHLKIPAGFFTNRAIPQVAALISISDLFISNDTGIMHVAGTTDTPQVSIFGPTNPFNWAPLGEDKFFIRKSELIDEVTVEEVFELCLSILGSQKERA